MHSSAHGVHLVDLGIEDCRSDFIDGQVTIHLILSTALLSSKVRVHHYAIVDNIDLLCVLDIDKLKFGQGCQELQERGQ